MSGPLSVRRLFQVARLANLGRHAHRGTLATHLVRKWFLRHVIAKLPFRRRSGTMTKPR